MDTFVIEVQVAQRYDAYHADRNRGEKKMKAGARRNDLIDRSTPVPLYFQIAEHLREVLIRDRMCKGDLLTTDERVQEEFGVSRATARKAIDELVDEGLVERITGKGTFVAEPRLQVPLPAMLSFTEEIKRRGMRPSSRVISVAWSIPPAHVAQALELEMGTRVLRLERIRYADSKPILYSLDFVPEGFGINVENDFTGSLYELMESRGIQLAECQNVIEAAVTGQRLARLLQVRVNFPVLALQRTTYDAAGCPVLYEDAACRSDLYRYAVRMVRHPHSPFSRRRSRTIPVDRRSRVQTHTSRKAVFQKLSTRS